jgi:hypothetical protein
METPQPGLSGKGKLRPVILWCLPSLLGFLLFLLSFPISRSIPFWPQVNLEEVFFFWFLVITPIAIVIAL